LELGKGFTFVERQKRIILDGKDFYLDLLFYNRKLKRLVAVELKLGEFKPALTIGNAQRFESNLRKLID
jgi:predicted nuclease of restriction endonuclease-like (RecB) superfamily